MAISPLGLALSMGSGALGQVVNNLVTPIVADVGQLFIDKVEKGEDTMENLIGWGANMLLGGLGQGMGWLSGMGGAAMGAFK